MDQARKNQNPFLKSCLRRIPACCARKYFAIGCCVLFLVGGQQLRGQETAEKPNAESPNASAAASPDAAQDSAAQTAAPAERPADILAVEQAGLADRFKQLKRMMLHLSEFSASSDPHRAGVLKQAIADSESQEVAAQFETVVKLLEKEQLALAEKNQTALRAELEKLLQLLLKEDRANRLDAEKKRIEGLIKEVGRIIKDQRGIKARTEGGDELPRLGEAQDKITEKAKQLAEQIQQDEAENKASSGEMPPAGEQQPSENNGEEKSPDSQPMPAGGEKQEPTEKQPNPERPGEKPAPAEPAPGGEKKPSEKAPQPGQPQPGQPQQKATPPAEGTPPEPAESDNSGESKPGQPNSKPPKGGSPQQPNPGGEQPPSEQAPPEESENMRVRKRIEAARERMEDAERKIAEAERKGAAEEQQKALDELEQAKAELEKILRQLREEEVERVLAQLEDRFRQMLRTQIEIYEGTQRLDKIAAADRGRDDEIEAGRLSRLEAQLVRDADKALNLLHEEGSAVAFPEAVGQMRDDMEQITVRLAQFKTEQITQGLETDVIAALEEMVAALKKAQQDLEDQKNQGQSPSQSGEPGDQALVDQLAELRMIRALQMRVNTRTKLYSSLITGEQAQDPELLKSLEELGQREERIHQVTRDLHLGKNK